MSGRLRRGRPRSRLGELVEVMVVVKDADCRVVCGGSDQEVREPDAALVERLNVCELSERRKCRIRDRARDRHVMERAEDCVPALDQAELSAM